MTTIADSVAAARGVAACAAVVLPLAALTGLDAIPARAAPVSPRLARDIDRTLDLPAETSYRVAETDLNGDGRNEAIVYVTERSFCGSGGCTLYILSPDRARRRVVMQATLVRLPIRRLSSSTHGWRDLSVSIGGGGISGSDQAILRFDGRRYPSNPTLPPAIRSARPRGEILLAP